MRIIGLPFFVCPTDSWERVDNEWKVVVGVVGFIPLRISTLRIDSSRLLHNFHFSRSAVTVVVIETSSDMSMMFKGKGKEKEKEKGKEKDAKEKVAKVSTNKEGKEKEFKDEDRKKAKAESTPREGKKSRKTSVSHTSSVTWLCAAYLSYSNVFFAPCFFIFNISSKKKFYPLSSQLSIVFKMDIEGREG